MIKTSFILCLSKRFCRICEADGTLSSLQVLKVVFPVYYGAQYQCEKVPKHAVLKALRAQRAAAEAQRAAVEAAKS